jgi:NADH dehydrogenase FAD-containing subunit
MEQKITGVTSTAIQTKAGDVTDAGLKVWTCGVRPTAFFRELKALGPVDSCLRLGGRQDVFVIGDCAGRPPTAQSARQQGEYLARQFNRRFFSGDAFEYKELGRIVDLEDRFVVEVGGFVFTVSSALRPVIHFFTR